MKKLLRISGIVLAALILLIVASILVVTTLINPNDFKDKINQVVQQKTGVELTINGNIKWSFYPRIGFKVHDITIKNLPKFQEQDSVSAGEIDVSVRLLPLLHKQIEIDNVVVKNANVLWTNPQTKQNVQIQNLQLRSNNITSHKPFKINSSFNFQTTNPNCRGHIVISSKIDFDLDNKLYKLGNLQITGTIQPQNFSPVNVKLSTDITTDLQQQTFKIKNMNLQVANLNIIGEIVGTKILDAPAFTGSLNIPPFNPKQFSTALGFKLQPQDKTALQTATMSLIFKTSPQLIQIPELQMTLDQSILQGNINTINIHYKRISFNLNLNKINLNRYKFKIIPLQATPIVKASTPEATTVTPLPVSPTSTPWNTKGNLRINQLTASRLVLNDLKIGVNSSKGIIKLDPITANLYGGSLNGQIKINQQTATPQISSMITLTNIQVNSLLNDLTNTKSLTGTANCNISLITAGKTANTMTKNLNGKGKISIKNGDLKGIDINHLLTIVSTLKSTKDIVIKPKSSSTDFGNLNATFIIRNGLLRNNDFLMAAATYQVAGRGTVNFVNQQVNYKVHASTVKTVTRSGKKIKQVSPALIPIHITGPFTDLKYTPDFSKVPQNLVKQVGQMVIQDIGKTQNLKDLGKQIGKNLDVGKLFN